LAAGELKTFYAAIAASEARHQGLFERLARAHFPAREVAARLAEWLDIEAEVIAMQPVRAALH